MADKDLIDAIARGIVVFDGAMGTTLQRMQLAGDLTVKDFEGRQGCNEILSLTRPDVVSGVHRSYLEIGCDVVETNTFGGSRPKLEEFELGARVAEVNEQAARIARTEADRAQRGDGRRRYVAGSLGPSGFLPSSSDPDLGRVSPAELTEIFRGLVSSRLLSVMVSTPSTSLAFTVCSSTVGGRVKLRMNRL